ncbi:MAG TPA: hypothetical protein DCY93_02515 [Firmicutes bacterium]|nr:hypothetical protein [Bacillota bacterium]
MIDLYELEAKPIPTIGDISSIPYYPYIANIELTLTDKTTLRTDDSFDKPYIEAKDSENNIINIEANSALENGDKLFEKAESLPLLNKFSVESLVFYSNTVARVFSANQIK